jgi:hypothetical protein
VCKDSRVASKEATGAPEVEIEITPEMAAAGSRALADMFEYAVADDWLTIERASEVFRRMCSARAQ